MRFVFLSIIAVLAIVAAVLAFRFADSAAPTSVGQASAPAEINIRTVKVLVARVNVPVGSIIDNSMIDEQPWPENLVMENFVLGDKAGHENLIGKIARSAIQAHEPFMKTKLANPNDPGFLAAGLPTGMRAITVATDAVSGIAGFIFPGDRVDVLFTHDDIVGGGGNVSGKPSTTEVLGSNIRVLAVNLREGDPSKPSPVSPHSVTLEVSDELAQLIRLAEKNGTLAFSLRSIHDDNPTAANPSGLEDLSNSSELVVVRGPGRAGGKITSSTALSDARDSGSVTDVVRGGGAEDSLDSQPVTQLPNNVNKSKNSAK